MLVGATAVADASDIGVVVPIAVALWAALAAYAWGHGRLALFVTIVPVYYGLAFGVAYQLEAPCGLREISPAIDQREEVVKWWPPHTVCELRMADGSREYDGGFPLTLLSPVPVGLRRICAGARAPTTRRPARRADRRYVVRCGRALVYLNQHA